MPVDQWGTDVVTAVAEAADVGRARIVVERIGPALADLPDDAVRTLVVVAGASDSLGDLLAEDDAARHVLTALDEPVALDRSGREALARSHRHERLRIMARDLTGRAGLDDTLVGLTGLAERTLSAALELAGADDLAVVGMGKLGAAELNPVSDVDVLFVSGGDLDADTHAARRVLEIAGPILRVDVDLRPQGRDGPLVRTVDSYAAHWERWAAAWEFQALLKARAVAGRSDIGATFDAAAARALWNRPFGSDDLREVRRMKARTEAVHGGGPGVDVKHAPGGIRDIEFSVQLLQLVHGGADPALRIRATLPALDALAAGGYVAGDEADVLAAAYRFLRDVEHRVQVVAERQTHRVPADRDGRRRVARALGYRGDTEAGPTDHFDHDLSLHRLAVRRVHEGWYFRPLLDAFAGVGTISDEVTAARLAAFGFQEPERTRQAVDELASGLTRSSRLMRQLLPLILDWLSDGPDPDLGLLSLRRLTDTEQRAQRIANTFRDSAETARRLCDLLTLSPAVADILVANPDLVERLADDDRLTLLPRDDLLASAWHTVGWRTSLDDQRVALHRWHRRHLLGVIARDVAGAIDGEGVGWALTALAEAVLETALRLAEPRVALAVVGLGRVGGAELGYGSDVDVVFVHDGADDRDRAEADRAAGHVLRLLQGATPATRVLTVDTDLRPEGKDGPLTRSLDSYTVYLERWAEVWERQALLRARPVAGDVGVGRGFGAVVEHALWSRSPNSDEIRAIRRMKARVEAERIPRGIDPQRHLKLGPGGLADIEWTVQLLQWTRGIRRQTTRGALDRLAAIGALDGDERAVLAGALDHLERLRNRAWLAFGTADVLPERHERLRLLARAMGGGDDPLDAASLGEVVRRHQRRARRVVEHRFYGAAT